MNGNNDQNSFADIQVDDINASKKPKLIPRERECLQWAAQGKTIEETAAILSISKQTVQSYLKRAKDKLGVYKITHAINRAIKLKII